MRQVYARIFSVVVISILILSAPVLGGGEPPQVTVNVPKGMSVKSASAVYAVDMAVKSKAAGEVSGQTITFSGLQPDQPYDITLTLADGSQLCGIDMDWYDDEPAKPDAGALTDDDREAIRAIVQDIPDFYNKKDILLLRGNHDRAVALSRLVRDKDFHAGGGNVIWRIELWYFKYYYGGWQKIAQVNKVLRRERYTSAAEMQAETEKLRWIPELGGIVLTKKHPTRTIDLPAESTTKP